MYKKAIGLILLIGTLALMIGCGKQNKSSETTDTKKENEEMLNEHFQTRTISGGSTVSAVITEDGKVVATEDKSWNYKGTSQTSGWKDIISVEAGHTVVLGLRADGTIVVTPNESEAFLQNDYIDDVLSWKDIVQIEEADGSFFGLKEDGTVNAAGKFWSNEDKAQEWEDIVKIGACRGTVVGLKKSGIVIRTKSDEKPSEDANGVEAWRDIVDISCGEHHTVGLKKDGTVVAVGDNSNGQCNVEEWADIVAVSAGYHHTVGLKEDGTVVATNYIDTEGFANDGQCNVNDWKDVVEISAGGFHTLGLKSDGTLLGTGWGEEGQLDIVKTVEKVKKPEEAILKETSSIDPISPVTYNNCYEELSYLPKLDSTVKVERSWRKEFDDTEEWPIDDDESNMVHFNVKYEYRFKNPKEAKKAFYHYYGLLPHIEGVSTRYLTDEEKAAFHKDSAVVEIICRDDYRVFLEREPETDLKDGNVMNDGDTIWVRFAKIKKDD